MENTYYSHIPEAIIPPRFSLFKIISLMVVFLVLTPVALATSIFSLIFMSSSAAPQKQVLAASSTNPRPVNIFAALPDTIPSVEASIGTGDARVAIIEEYLTRYKSPLIDHAAYIVQIADENDLDFRLITAIAQQESNLCKKIPEGSFNCWGWGIHSRGTLGFESFEEGIRTVSAGVKKEYIDKGYLSPEEIMSKYTPMSNGSWASGVTIFMEDME